MPTISTINTTTNTALSATTPEPSANLLRDNTPHCLIPEASGTLSYSYDVCTIDASNASEGYIMVDYFGFSPKVKLQITGPSEITYTYNLTSGYETFPLSSESGTYHVAVYEVVSGNQYANVASEFIDVSINNEFGPYLYPNQYINFDANSSCVSIGSELASNASNELEVVNSVYNYVIQTIIYDYDKAENVQSGYVPTVDEIISSKKGICLDYAAVMSCMLRSQSIPTRLEVGYAGEAYHAWISTYITDIGWVNGMIEFDGKGWKIMDPTFAANTSEKKLRDFIGNGDKYVTKYIY